MNTYSHEKKRTINYVNVCYIVEEAIATSTSVSELSSLDSKYQTRHAYKSLINV